MPTEDDLRTALTTLEVEAPDVGTMLATTYRRHHRRTVRRRVTGMVAAAAVTVLLAAASIAVPKLLSSGPPTPPAEPAGDPTWRFSFDFDAPGVHFYRREIIDDHTQFGLVSSDTYPHVGNFAVYKFEKGALDPTNGRAGEPVDVNGKTGSYLQEMQCCAGVTPQPGVAWKYAPDAWALVLAQLPAHLRNSSRLEGLKDELTRLARLARLDRSIPLQVPYQVEYLPPGLHASPGRRASLIDDAENNIRTTTVWLIGSDPNVPDLIITASERRDLPAQPSPQAAVLYDDDAQGTGVELLVPKFKLTVSSGGDHRPRMPASELIKIANSVDPVFDPTNRDNWVEAEKVLPTG